MSISEYFYHPLKVKAFVCLAVVFYVSLTFSRSFRRALKTKKKVINPANLNTRTASNVPIAEKPMPASQEFSCLARFFDQLESNT